MKESELAIKFVEYFSEGYEIYKEVPGGGIIDIYAVCGAISIAIEVKTSFNIDVIAQAHKNTRYATLSYVAIPAGKRTFAYEICRMLGIGILVYDDMYKQVGERLAPRINRAIGKPKLEEWMKQNTAGVQSDRITAFSHTVEQITFYLRRKGGSAPIEEVLKDVRHHYQTPSSARLCLKKWCRTGAITAFKFENGEFILTT